MDIKNFTAAKIRFYRKAKGLTQKELGEKIGVKHNTVSGYESGTNEPEQNILFKIAAALEISINDLFPATTTPHTQSPAPALGDLPANVLMDKNKKPQSSDIDIFSIPNIEPLRLKKVPILGTIAAGVPITAEENFDGFAECDVSVKADFALKIQGESMINAGIEDGDYVFIHAAPVVNEGQIAAVLIDGEATLKRFYRHGKGIELRPANDTMKSFFYSEGDCDEFRILGRAVAVLHAL